MQTWPNEQTELDEMGVSEKHQEAARVVVICLVGGAVIVGWYLAKWWGLV